jgi:hypothetical protein
VQSVHERPRHRDDARVVDPEEVKTPVVLEAGRIDEDMDAGSPEDFWADGKFLRPLEVDARADVRERYSFLQENVTASGS